MKPKALEADFAISLRPEEARDLKKLTECYHWQGWKNHHWPADIIRKGLRFYGFDTQSRRLCVLLQVTRGGSFTYQTRRQFTKKVTDLTEWKPSQEDPYWFGLPIAQPGKYCTGIALRWKVIKPVDIPRRHRFPQLGWERLREGNQLPDIDPLEAFVEGDKRLRSHLSTERNATLRARAKEYWQTKLGKLCCLVCGFSFEETYGNVGAGFIEMHHDVPLAISGKSVNTPRNLKPVCSNCHRMIHRQPYQPLNINTLKRRLKSKV